MLNTLSFSILSASFGVLLAAPVAYGQTTVPEKTTTTTIEQTTTVTPAPTPTKKKVTTPAKTPAAKPVEQTTTIQSSTITTEVKPPPKKEVVRKVYDEETLNKMRDNLCTQGFKAYVGSDKKNVCMGKASPPDIAYSCIWHKKGAGAFAPTAQGPCSLDYAEHKGSIVIMKENFPHDAPMDYGMEAQCCFRAAKGLEPAASR